MSALRKITCFYITIYFIKRDLFSFKTCVLCVKITPPIKLQTEKSQKPEYRKLFSLLHLLHCSDPLSRF